MQLQPVSRSELQAVEGGRGELQYMAIGTFVGLCVGGGAGAFVGAFFGGILDCIGHLLS
jgi:hypothetical protein